MCGVPHHAVQNYIDILIDKGYKVAICEQMEEAVFHGAKIVVFPELCITGYTCGDLFLQNLLLEEAKEAFIERFP